MELCYVTFNLKSYYQITGANSKPYLQQGCNCLASKKLKNLQGNFSFISQKNEPTDNKFKNI